VSVLNFVEGPALGSSKGLFYPPDPASKAVVLLFSRILDFEEDQIKEVERRREQRYAPGRPFPLQATIEVDGEPRSARIIDLSPGGAGLQVSGPSYARGSLAKLHLMIEESWMEFACTIAHVRTLSSGCRLGLTAEFASFAQKKAYLQLLQPIAIGSLFRPVPADEVSQVDPGMHKMLFTGRPGTELNVWCQSDASGPLYSFFCEMDDYLVQGARGAAEMLISAKKYMVDPARSKTATPAFRKLPAGMRDEIRLLFRWTMMNLPKDLPAEVRSFMQEFEN
jgi:PilZ domain